MTLLRVVASFHLLPLLQVAPLLLQQNRRELETSKLGWLHTPKAGTSFANVLIAWKCPGMLGRMEKETKAMANKFCQHHGEDCPVARSLCSSHSPILSSNDGFNESVSHHWETKRGNFVGMIRRPMQRHMSGYLDRQIMSTFGVPVIHGKYDSALAYAQANAGCTTKLLTGLPCNDEFQATEAMVPMAMARMSAGFAFIGLTEEWGLSVCLFHRMFGGECAEHEFNNVRPGRAHQKEYDLKDFKGWRDPFDAPVYEHGSRIFWSNIEKYNVSRESCSVGVCSKAKRFFM